MHHLIFISCPKGLEYLLEDELKTLGLAITQVNPQGVWGQADLELIYRICLWSRIANRVHLILLKTPAKNKDDIYQACAQFPWENVFTPDKSLAVEFHGTTPAIRNAMFGAQIIKDGIVDYWRSRAGFRPEVDKQRPDIRIQGYLNHGELTLSLDIMGGSLHQRGYRLDRGLAPLKENLAAALLLRAKWPHLAEQGYALHDPCCGSGTLVIEAAMMAANVAPGLLRDDHALNAWIHHQPTLWSTLREQAKAKISPPSMSLRGTDKDASIIYKARENAKRAGVEAWVSFESCSLEHIQPSASPGLLISNPPYGERLEDQMSVIPLYQQLGKVLYHAYSGWEAAILTATPMLAKAIGLRAHKHYAFYNGALACQLYCFSLTNNRLRETPDVMSSSTTAVRWSEDAQMFANRLQKNVTHLRKWAKREQITCYRVYDADLPEYAYAIDVYNDYAVLQEYKAPPSIEAHRAEKRRLDVVQVVPHVLGIPPSHLVHKERQAQKGRQQYEKRGHERQFMTVTEGQSTFRVNLYDYLDTGLFLDHRRLRLSFEKLAPGTRFLNCFCYTATASVHAAMAGAITTNVDLSNTYLQWARENFKLNKLPVDRHQFVQFDCLEWLNLARDRFDVIFLDPPSFSNSKRMKAVLDIQRDHPMLINAAMRLLASDGILYFSTPLRHFKMDPTLASQFEIHDITRDTIDIDFKRNQRIHHCFEIRKT